MKREEKCKCKFGKTKCLAGRPVVLRRVRALWNVSTYVVFCLVFVGNVEDVR